MNRWSSIFLASIAFGVSFSIALPDCSLAEGSANILSSQEREKILAECNRLDYNERCAKFYESEFFPKRSEEFCNAHPADESCYSRRKAKEAKEESLSKLAKERELEAYCLSEPTAKRCKMRKYRAKQLAIRLRNKD